MRARTFCPRCGVYTPGPECETCAVEEPSAEELLAFVCQHVLNLEDHHEAGWWLHAEYEVNELLPRGPANVLEALRAAYAVRETGEMLAAVEALRHEA